MSHKSALPAVRHSCLVAQRGRASPRQPEQLVGCDVAKDELRPVGGAVPCWSEVEVAAAQFRIFPEWRPRKALWPVNTAALTACTDFS